MPQHLQRLRDWPQRLHALVCARQHTPFAWGTHDCCMWAADAVHAITGHDPAADLRGTYATAAQAQALLDAHGGLPGLAAARLGPLVPAALAQPGDIGLAPTGSGRLALVVVTGGVALAAATNGLAPVALPQLRRVWRVCPPAPATPATPPAAATVPHG